MIHKRILTPRHLAGASIATAALATGLNAGAAAAALTFNFGFNGDGEPTKPSSVTGTISGLVDNLANQKIGLTAIITSATNTPVGGWPPFSTYWFGNGSTVSNGAVTTADIAFSEGDSNLRVRAHQPAPCFNAELPLFLSRTRSGFLNHSHPPLFSRASSPLPRPSRVPCRCSERLRRLASAVACAAG